MLYLALALFIFALFFFRKSSIQRKEAGLPGGRMPGLPGLPGLPKGPKK